MRLRLQCLHRESDRGCGTAKAGDGSPEIVRRDISDFVIASVSEAIQLSARVDSWIARSFLSLLAMTGLLAASVGRERVVDQFPERGRDALALGLGLLQQDVDHVEFWIDAEISAAAAVPFQLADRAGRRRLGNARIGAHGDAVAIAKAVAGKVPVVAADAGARSDVIGRHVFEGGGAEIALSAKLAAVEQHLREACIICYGRHQSAATGFPLRMRTPIALPLDQDRVR